MLSDEEIYKIQLQAQKSDYPVYTVFARMIEDAVLAKASQQVQGEPVQDETDIVDEYDGESLAASRVHWDEFKKWWYDHGQYIRAGGGNYERSFAWKAWNWAIFQNSKAMPTPKQEPVVQREFSDDEYICIRDAVDRLIDAVGKEVDGDQSECSLVAEFIDEIIRDVIKPLKIKWFEDDEECGYMHSRCALNDMASPPQAAAIPESIAKKIWAHGFDRGHNEGIGCGHSLAPRCRHDSDKEAEDHSDEIRGILSAAPKPD